MSHISETNNLSHTIARQAVTDEPWFKRMSAENRERCVADVASEISNAVNARINDYRECLGAFDGEPYRATAGESGR